MIVEYNEDGMVTHVISSYMPQLVEKLREMGRPFVQIQERPDFNMVTQGYVEGGEIKRRPVLDIQVSDTVIQADGEDEAVLSGLPDPCDVWIDGVKHEVTGGELRISSPMPATYRIAIERWPYMAWAVAIEASPVE